MLPHFTAMDFINIHPLFDVIPRTNRVDGYLSYWLYIGPIFAGLVQCIFVLLVTLLPCTLSWSTDFFYCRLHFKHSCGGYLTRIPPARLSLRPLLFKPYNDRQVLKFSGACCTTAVNTLKTYFYPLHLSPPAAEIHNLLLSCVSL